MPNWVFVKTAGGCLDSDGHHGHRPSHTGSAAARLRGDLNIQYTEPHTQTTGLFALLYNTSLLFYWNVFILFTFALLLFNVVNVSRWEIAHHLL